MAVQKLKRPRSSRKPSLRTPDWLSVKDLAAALDVCTATVYRYIEQGIIPAIRVDTPGGKARFKIDREWALKYLRGEVGHVPTPKPHLGSKVEPPSARQLRLCE